MNIGWKNAPQISWQDHGAFPVLWARRFTCDIKDNDVDNGMDYDVIWFVYLFICVF